MKKSLLLSFVLAALLLCMASCKKETKCRCITTENPDQPVTSYIYVDPTMSCSKITHMGYEITAGTSTRREMKEVECTKVKKNDIDSDNR